MVDRGANGGIGGADTRDLYPGEDRPTIDLSGIDDHTVLALRLTSVGSYALTSRGPVILIMHQYAHMPDGKTIHSCAQMEAFGARVQDKSPNTLVNDLDPMIELVEGHMMPLQITNGLPYLNVRPFTDHEFKVLPHVLLTSPAPWDPTCVDTRVNERDWCSKHAKAPSLPPNEYQDEYGENRIPHDAEEDVGEVEETLPVTSPTPNADITPAEASGLTPVSVHHVKRYLAHLVRRETVDQFMVFSARDMATTLDCYPLRWSARNKGGTKDYSEKRKVTKRRPTRKVLPSPNTPDSTPKGTHPLSIEDNGPFRVNPGQLPDDPPDQAYNNPAKDATYKPTGDYLWEGGPKRVKAKRPTIDKIERFFYGIPRAAIAKTLKCTTQFGRIGAVKGLHLHKRIKAPNPALNVTRRNEMVSMDTVYGPRKIPAIEVGATCAQFFIGRKSQFRAIYPCGNSDAARNVLRTIMDEVRKRGAPVTIGSDRARSELARMVEDYFRLMGILRFTSEAYNKNQNFSERGWFPTQEHSNTMLATSNAPLASWLLALELIIFVQNHVAIKSLGWRTPFEWIYGYTPDISVMLQFVFWEPVYYSTGTTSTGEDGEEVGRFAGIAESIGHGMTYKVVTDDGRIINRAVIRSAAMGGIRRNLRADKRSPTMAPARRQIELRSPYTKEDFEEATIHKDESTAKGTDRLISADPKDPISPEEVEVETVEDEDDTIPQSEDDAAPHLTPDTQSHHTEWIHGGEDPPVYVEVDSLLGRTFVTPPSKERLQEWATIKHIEDTGTTTPDGRRKLYKFRSSVGKEVYDEIRTYNEMLEWCERDTLKDDMYRLDAITSHKKGKLPGSDTTQWLVRVLWGNGEETWAPLSQVFADDAATVALYAYENKLLEVDGWKRCKRLIKNTKILARMANQVKLRSFRRRPRYKFGKQVPRDTQEARFLDKKDGTTCWEEAIQKEMSQLEEYETFKDLGKDAKVPEGYTKIPCHLVYDCKPERVKARFVAGGHRTDTPIESVYSGVVSLEGIRICTLLAELNDCELWSTDIGNAYLESYTKEKVCFRAGPEFGDREGHLMVVIKALYGLKSSGKRWHERLHDVLTNMGFKPSRVEEDIWMRDKGTHYEYIAVYVDDLMIVSKNPKSIVHDLEITHRFKLKGTGPTSYHLGCNYWRDDDGTLCVGPTAYIDKMVAEYERLYGSKPQTLYQSPLDKNDHPEIDTSAIMDEDGILQYQSLIGELQWAITLGRFDVATAVMTMSAFRVAPRAGHLDRVKRICGYIYKHKSACIRVRTEKPDYSDIPVPDYDWARSVYGECKEQVPNDCPIPRGKPVITTTYKDANLYHDLMSGKAVTGVLHFVNQTPVKWFTKKQETVESATYGSEFVAARKAVQQIEELRLTLRYLGVPLEGPSYLFGDNEAVVRSGSVPHSQLTKRHHGLSYHYVRSMVASGVIRFYHMPGAANPADILSKHWARADVWPMLQPILFWKGDTAVLLRASGAKEGSDKSSFSPDPNGGQR